MLPRSHRLRLTREIQQTLRSGTCLAMPFVKVCYSPSTNLHTRIACVVGKSVHRSAVRRHRYQRWLRALARQLLREEPLPHSYDMVWIAQPSIQKAPSLAAVVESVAPRWKKLRDTL